MNSSQANKTILAAIREALASLDADSLTTLKAQAIRHGRTLEEQAWYKLAAHRGLVPVDPGDRDTAEFAMLHWRMTHGKLLSDG